MKALLFGGEPCRAKDPQRKVCSRNESYRPILDKNERRVTRVEPCPSASFKPYRVAYCSRFSDPANCLPDSVWIRDFVHTFDRVAVRWIRRGSKPLAKQTEKNRDREKVVIAMREEMARKIAAHARSESHRHPRAGSLSLNDASGVFSGHTSINPGIYSRVKRNSSRCAIILFLAVIQGYAANQILNCIGIVRTAA
jgi:hypothetical protein